MDSLGRMELQLWLEREFGFHDIDPESLRTVADVLLAACGRTVGAGPKALKPVPAAWFRKSTKPAEVPSGTTLTEVFLKQAARDPSRVLAADQTGGARTFRSVVTGILALRPHFAALEGTVRGAHAARHRRRLHPLPGPALRREDPGDGELDRGLPQPGARPGPARGEARPHGRAAGDQGGVPGHGSLRHQGPPGPPGGPRQAHQQGRQAPGPPEGPLQLVRPAQGPGPRHRRGALHQRQREPAQGRAPHPRQPPGQCPGPGGLLRLQPRRADDRHPAALPFLRPQLHRDPALLHGLPGGLPPQPHGGSGPGADRGGLRRHHAGGHPHLPAGHHPGRQGRAAPLPAHGHHRRREVPRGPVRGRWRAAGRSSRCRRATASPSAPR